MNDIVERIEKVVEEAEREHAPLTFAALVMPDDSEVSQYDLIVSSPWFIEEGKVKTYKYLTDKLSKYLQREDWSLLNRILLMNPEDKFIQYLTQDAERYNDRDFVNLHYPGFNLRAAHIFAALSDGSAVKLRSYAQ